MRFSALTGTELDRKDSFDRPGARKWDGDKRQELCGFLATAYGNSSLISRYLWEGKGMVAFHWSAFVFVTWVWSEGFKNERKFLMMSVSTAYCKSVPIKLGFRKEWEEGWLEGNGVGSRSTKGMERRYLVKVSWAPSMVESPEKGSPLIKSQQ